jgi:hypothetical protein
MPPHCLCRRGRKILVVLALLKALSVPLLPLRSDAHLQLLYKFRNNRHLLTLELSLRAFTPPVLLDNVIQQVYHPRDRPVSARSRTGQGGGVVRLNTASGL